MKKDWLEVAMTLSARDADFYSGARKILTNQHFTFTRIKSDLTLADSGYTRSKQTMLTKAYLNEESHSAALKLWARRVDQDKYGSVGFSTYNHLVKGSQSLDDAIKRTGRASVMGPCIQSVVLTLHPKIGTTVDVFYRTTELFKKFPADLVFIRDILLPPFDITPRAINFHFANVTCHPMYFVTMIPLLDDPLKALDLIKRKDKHFFDWVVKWTARYLCPDYFRGIEKFAQAMRVRSDAQARIPRMLMRPLIKYLRDNHPGYRNDYVEPEDE